MRSFPTLFALALVAALPLSTACTLNVSSFDREIESTSDDGVSEIGVDLRSIEPELGGAPLYVRGAERTDARAAARLVGLRGGGTTEDALLEGWSLSFVTREARALDLAVRAGARSDTFLDRITVDVPREADVTIDVAATDVQLDDLSGRAEVTTDSGNVRARTDGVVELTSQSGSMIVEAAEGTLTTSSGSMHLSIAGWVNATADSGSIVGDIGDGGRIETESGSIDVELTAPLTRELRVSADSGSIILRVPADAPLSLDVATESGGVLIRLPDASYDGRAYVGTNAGGGPLLHVRAGAGSIHVVAGE